MGHITLKTLMKPENEAEANVIKSVLAENGIYAEIKSFHDTAYDGLSNLNMAGAWFAFPRRTFRKPKKSSKNGAMPLLKNSHGTSNQRIKG